MGENDEMVVVGRIGKAHGLRGEVSVAVTTDVPDLRFADGAVLTLEPQSGSANSSMPSRAVQSAPPVVDRLTVSGTRWHSGRLLVTFDEIGDRTAAESLRGAVLLADVGQVALDDPDEFFDHQLRGLRAIDLAGEPMGTVVDVVHLPGQDLLAVELPDSGQMLVPFVSQFVPEVRLVEHVVVLDPPQGLAE